MLLGQGTIPRGHDPRADIKSDAPVTERLGNIELAIGKWVKVAPAHADYIARTRPAPM
ncbi:MAG: hypothetical protein WC068_05485 [Caulobacter sp.]